VVRELGLERRETVRSLSTAIFKNMENVTLVREEQVAYTSGLSVVLSKAPPSS